MRGDLHVILDKDVKDTNFNGGNVVLFGDPGSNSVLAEQLEHLPIKWTKNEVGFVGKGQKTYPAADHYPAFVFAADKSLSSGNVVVNSGHTFHAAEFMGTNAQLYPRLGDYAILKATPKDKEPAATETAVAGLFDDDWKLP